MTEKIKKSDIEDIVELNSVQEGMLFHYLENPTSDCYFEQTSFEFEGTIIPDKIKSAWEKVVDNNSALRSVFRWNGLEQPIQIILKKNELDFIYYDFSNIKDEGDLQAKCRSLIMDDRKNIFSLEKVPFRIILCKKSERTCLLIISAHHIILDGWSSGIILNQFMNFYNDDNYILNGKNFKISDYVHYMRSYNYTEGIDYWKNYLKDISSPTLLKGIDNEKGLENSCSFKIRSDIVNDFTKKNKITLAELCYFSWALLLRNYLNREDVVFGTTLSGRNISVSGINQAVGLFINTVPLRVIISDNSSVEEIISNVRKSLVDRQDYEVVSQSKINQALNVDKNEPMYDSIVVVENYPLDTNADDKKLINLKEYSIFEKTNYNITVNVSEQNNFINVQLLYNNNIFSDDFIKNMLKHFEIIIMNIIDDGLSKKCIDVKLVSEEEKNMIEAFNNTSCNYNYSSCVHYEFEKNAAIYHDKNAVIFDKKTMTYAELNNIVNFYAQILKTAGIKNNTIVGILFERSFEMIVAILAVLKAGGAYMPIAVDVPEERLRYIINDSGIKTILTISNFYDRFNDYSDLNVICLDSSDYNCEIIYDNPEHINEMNDLAYIIYTSGTTGNPKGVMIEHHSLMNRIGWMDKAYPLSTGDTILQKTPYTFDVSVWELLWWSQKGACLCFLKQDDEKNPQIIIDEIFNNNITVMHFVPAMFSVFIEYLEENGEYTNKISSLKRIFTSGEALNANQVNRFYMINNSAEIVNLYGPTEATIDVSYYNCIRGINYKVIPIGKPIDNTKLYIVNSANNIQPIGVAGELCICGANLARGYLNKPELTNKKFCSDSKDINQRFYKTGDIARLMPDGNIEYLGRCDDQVKIRGLRIELGEIENVIGRYDNIAEVAVAVKKSNMGDNQIIAYYVLKNTDEKLDINDIKQFMLRYSPEYMIPAYFVEISEMPKSANGKINRKELLKINIENDIGTEYKAPETEIQLKILEIWHTLIDIEKISIYDNFFMIGGDSIRAIRLVSKLNKAFGINITISDLYSNCTIFDLEKIILNYDKFENNEDSIRERIKKEIDEDSKRFLAMSENTDNIEDIFQLTDIQNGMVLLYLKDEKKDIYFEQFIIETKYNNFESEKYKQALEIVAMENPILRTSFEMEKYLEPVQIVYKHYDIEYNYVYFDNDADAKECLEKTIKEDKSRKFKIAEGEKLWRFTVISINNNFEFFILTVHHAILDGWSINSLLALVHEKYNILLTGCEYKVKDLGITYKDALIDERTEKCNQEHKKFWLDELSDYKRLNLDVCYDHNRPEVHKKITKTHTYGIGLYEKLKSTANDMNTTIKNICFSAYIYTLKLLSGQNDFVVGYLVNNRTVHENGDKILGCYLNTIPFRVQIPYGVSWRQFQRQIDLKILKIKKYERMPLFEISQIVGEKTSDNVFFDTLYNYMDFSMIQDLDVDDLVNLSVYAGHEDTNTLFDFMLDVSKRQMKLTLRYNTSIFSDGAEEYIFEYFKNILDQFINECDRIIDTDSILGNSEKNLIINEFNATDAEYNKEITLNELFEKSVSLHGNNNAIVFSNGRKITYTELNETSNQIANMLRENGVTRNEFVAVFMERSPEMIATIMGILKAGGAYLPIETYLPDARIESMLKSTNASKIITSDSLIKRVNEIAVDMDKKFVISVNAPIIKSYKTTAPIRINESTDIAYVIFTSGTTGTPKGVYVNHMTVVNVLEWVTKNYNVNENDKLLFVTSICFDLSVYDMFGILAVGGTLRLTDSEELQEPEKLLNIINKEEITFWDSAPQALMRLVPFMSDMKTKNSSLRLVFLSGDWIPVTLPDELRAHFENLEVVSLGGATEATIWSNYYNIDAVGSTWKSIPYGRPIQNARYYVLGDNYSIRPIGTPGELYIGGIDGNCLALGYINDQKLTDSKFVASPFNENEKLYRTGDMARWYKNGTMEFLGRADFQVKIHGYRIEIEEIERQLLQLDGVKQAVVIAKEIKDSEKLLCAFVVCTSLNEETIKSKLSDNIPKYMIPAHIIIMDSIPMTKNGKVDKKKLDNYKITIAPVAYNYAKTLVQEQIEEIWKEILDIKERIPIDISFYEYGGNSLNASMLAARINKKFGVKIPLKELFTNNTISEQAEIIEIYRNENSKNSDVKDIAIVSDQVGSTEAQEVARTNEFNFASFEQKRMYMSYITNKKSLAYNNSLCMEINGHLDVKKLEDAFKNVINNNEILLSNYFMDNDDIVYKIDKNKEFKLDIYSLSSNDVEQFISDFIRPFDLEKDLLIRAGVASIDEDTHIIIVDLHHIVVDGISVEIIKQEIIMNYFNVAYDAKKKKQYSDFIKQQLENDRNGKFEEMRKYWTSLFAEEEIPKIQWPVEKNYKLFDEHNGNSKLFTINEKIYEEIKELSQKKNATVYMLLMAVYNVLLYKLTSQKEFIVGMPISCRDPENFIDVVGLMINTLPIKNKLDGNMSFDSFLDSVCKRCLEAYECKSYPYEKIVECIEYSNTQGDNSLYDTILAMQNMKKAKYDYNEWHIYEHEVNHKATKVDISFDFTENNGALQCRIEYDKDIFTDKLINRFINGFTSIFKEVCKRPDIMIKDIDTYNDDLPLLLRNEMYIHYEYDENYTVVDMLNEQFVLSSENEAVYSYGVVLSYRELDNITNYVADKLVKKYGCNDNNDTIAGILCDRTYEMIVLIISYWKAGIAYTPLDNLVPEERFRFIVSDSNSVAVVCSDNYYDFGQECCKGKCDCFSYSSLIDGYDKNLCYEKINRCIPEKSAYVIYTSGTTGKPKGVLIRHKNIINSVIWKKKEFAFNETDRILQMFSFMFDGFVLNFLQPLVSGSVLHVIKNEKANDVLYISKYLTKQKITYICTVPQFFGAILECMNADDLKYLKIVSLAGDKLKKEIIDNAKNKKPNLEICNEYGPTEASVVVSCNRNVSGENCNILGKPIFNTHLLVLDENLKLSNINVPGQLCVSGKGIASGYLNMPELSNEKFIPSPFFENEIMYLTGDVVRINEEGEIEFIGRNDSQVKIHGYRIEINEIVNALSEIKEINDVAVVARNDRSDKYLCAFYVAEKELELHVLKKHLYKCLPGYMIPSHFVKLDSLPLTPMGKIDEKALKSMSISEYEKTSVECVPPTNDIEKTLVEIWSEIFNSNNIGIDTNFFDLGGNSLNIAKMYNKVTKCYPVELTITTMYKYPSVRMLAEYINNLLLGENVSALDEKELDESSEVFDNITSLFGDDNFE